MVTAEQILPAQPRGSLDGLTRPIGQDTSRRVLGFLGLFRALVAAALLLPALVYRDPVVFGDRAPALFAGCAAAYLAFALTVLLFQRRRPFVRPLLIVGMLFADILAITVLIYGSGGIRSGIGGLLVIFVGAAALTLRGRHAFFAAAVATIAVLLQQLAAYLQGIAPEGEFFAAGVLGAVIFVAASLTYPLARRLEESEALAHQRGIDLANLAQLNEYIIQNLRESIVVVDEAGRIRLINQSAAEHLGVPAGQAGQSLAEVAPELHRRLEKWRRVGNQLLQPPPFMAADGSTRINPYVAPLADPSRGPLLLFLEDTSRLAEKLQQSKLAALGRLSASIAHEIRNPVGALSHAGQLLAESPAIGAEEQRLLDIIRTNSRRVSDIVENVLQLSRREATHPELISLRDWTEEFAREFTSTLELMEGQLSVLPGEDAEVRMDPGHLRQVVWNLCENALKYASETAGGIAIEMSFGRMPATRRPYLEVADRGPGIMPELQDQLFEPFATGKQGGTGLGLFISRELCECNRAALAYEPRRGGGAIFRLVFADPARWGLET